MFLLFFYAEFVWFIAEYNEKLRLEIKISIRDCAKIAQNLSVQIQSLFCCNPKQTFASEDNKIFANASGVMDIRRIIQM